jgi:hypothetical protein
VTIPEIQSLDGKQPASPSQRVFSLSMECLLHKHTHLNKTTPLHSPFPQKQAHLPSTQILPTASPLQPAPLQAPKRKHSSSSAAGPVPHSPPPPPNILHPRPHVSTPLPPSSQTRHLPDARFSEDHRSIGASPALPHPHPQPNRRTLCIETFPSRRRAL